MARLFISYKREEQDYAFAIRQWLMQPQQGWSSEDIFIDVGHLHAGDEWETKILTQAETAHAMLFLASALSLDTGSFCYQELRQAEGHVLAVTIKGVAPDDNRLERAIPNRAKHRQITALDQEPAEPFYFVSPKDNSHGSVRLNRKQVEGIGQTLRDLGVAPNSFVWKPVDTGPFPGLQPFMEGDEAIFCGRDIEIRDGLKEIEDLCATRTRRALVIQAPSGAGKSSFLRAGLWRRLRRSHFSPLAIIRSQKGAIRHEKWGLAAGLFDTLTRSPELARRLPLARDDLAIRVATDLPGLLAAFADADMAEGTSRRTLLLGIDQAEEMTMLSAEDNAELDWLLQTLFTLPKDLDLRLILTARDDSVDATLARLARAGLPQDKIGTWRLRRLLASRFDEIIQGPAAAANRAGWKIDIDPALVDALASAAGAGVSAEEGDALPILALALRRLVDKKRTADGLITLAPSDAACFLASAVEDTTAEALRDASATEEDLRRLVIPCLATWDPEAGTDGAAKRQVANASTLFAGDRATLKPLADSLVRRRLLTVSSGPTLARDNPAEEVGVTDTTYEVAHEALLRVPPLDQMIAQCHAKFELVSFLEKEAAEWLEFGKTTERLARRGDRLGEALDLLNDPDFGPKLKGEVSAVPHYLEACKAHEHSELDRQHRIMGRAFVKPARLALINGLNDQALRLVAAGALLAKDPNLELVPELWSPAVEAISRSRTAAILEHAGPVMAVAFSPDGNCLVTASSDHMGRVWNAETGTLIVLLEGHQGNVWSAAYSPDGTRIVTASDDNTARIWDAQSGITIACLQGHEATVNRAAFSPDGTRIVTASWDNTAQIWDAHSGAAIARLEGHSDRVKSAVFSSDGRRVVSASYDRTARIWDVQTSALIACLDGHSGAVRSAVFSPDGNHVITGSSDHTARVWDAERGTLSKLLEGRRDVKSAVFSPDGSFIVTASHDRVARVWETKTGALIACLEGHEGTVKSAMFSADGSRIVTASRDKTAQVWDAQSGFLIAQLLGHEASVNCAVFSPDGSRIVTASNDHTARIWDAQSAATAASLQGHSDRVRSAAFSPDGSRIITASWDNTARIWDPKTFALTGCLEGHQGAVGSAVFSPDGNSIVTGSSDRTARIWDAQTCVTISQLDGHSDWVRCAAFSPDGSHIVTASNDHTARIWDAQSGATVACLEGHTDWVWSAAFSPDGSRIVTASNDRVARIWDVKSCATITCLEGHMQSVRSAAFNPDGNRIVTCSDDHTARVWETKSGALIACLEGHSRKVTSASFSPDGSRIVTASDDLTARIWDAATGASIARLDGHVQAVRSAAFSPDGKCVVTGSSDNTARIWDVSRTAVMDRDRAVILAAVLACGIGRRTKEEAKDLLMQDAPEDLHAAFLEKLSPAGSAQVSAAVAALRAPLHPNCYLSPTQFAERFGIAKAGEKPETHELKGKGNDADPPPDRGNSPSREPKSSLTEEPESVVDKPTPEGGNTSRPPVESLSPPTTVLRPALVMALLVLSTFLGALGALIAIGYLDLNGILQELQHLVQRKFLPPS